MKSKELHNIRELLLQMAFLVESSIKKSVTALLDRSDELANKVVEEDHKINSYDVLIDDKCITLIALTQPMAKDLRFITTAMKITSDLERIADNSVNIANRAQELNKEPALKLKSTIDILRMKEVAGGMVRDVIDAFINENKKLAMDVIMRDDEIDEINDINLNELMSLMTGDPTTVSRAMKLSYVSKYLERIADHATNIAEVIIYMVEGKIIRHTGQINPLS